ncbi:IDEAL domain-containing protein [Halobacillus massiliensis]|uniref:IDEAL domain-containing protein n=1 Tax=Halobacillus massiliensis TaxID=1926286 RepID=UPI0009E54CFE|nr:IDEAL domain-containing protein [Halobacillus massiliensis]
MLNIKMLKPYYVKEDKRFIRVVLAYQYFSLFIDDELYQFIPMESREIIYDRESKRIHNVFDIFVFQRGKRTVYVSVADLLKLPEFLTHLNSIIMPFDRQKKETLKIEDTKTDLIIQELEKENLRRMIDLALDAKDIDKFNELAAKWSKVNS